MLHGVDSKEENCVIAEAPIYRDVMSMFVQLLFHRCKIRSIVSTSQQGEGGGKPIPIVAIITYIHTVYRCLRQ